MAVRYGSGYIGFGHLNVRLDSNAGLPEVLPSNPRFLTIMYIMYSVVHGHRDSVGYRSHIWQPHLRAASASNISLRLLSRYRGLRIVRERECDLETPGKGWEFITASSQAMTGNPQIPRSTPHQAPGPENPERRLSLPRAWIIGYTCNGRNALRRQ